MQSRIFERRSRVSNALTCRRRRRPYSPIGVLVLCVCLLFALALTPQDPSPRVVDHAVRSDYTYGQGYIEAGANGGAYAFGNANYYNSTFSVNGESAQSWWGNPIVGVAALSGNNGYYFVSNDTNADDSVTCAFGPGAWAYYFYPTPASYRQNWCTLTWPNVDDITGIAVDNANSGYWEVGYDGGIFAFYGAGYYGSAHGILPSGQGVVAIAGTPDGGGYWEVTQGGDVYAYGDAQYEGGISGSLNCPIVGVAAGPNDSSYWMDGCDGGVFSYGGAQAYGSLAATAKYFNIQAIASTPDGNGFYLMAFDGSLFTYGDAQFQGNIYPYSTYGQTVGVAGTS
jgi:hypothetical protein